MSVRPRRSSTRVRPLAAGLLLAALLGAASARAGECLGDNDGDHQFDFARVIYLEKDSTRLGQRAQLQSACTNLDLRQNRILAEARAQMPQRDYRATDVASEIEMTREAIAWKPGDSDVEQSFYRRIKKIGEERDALQRIKSVYNLVNAHRGTYKLYEWDGRPNPGKTLLKAAYTGTGGVCRDFAALLVWSLNQVAKGRSGDAEFSVQTKHIPQHALAAVRLFSAPGDRSEKDLRFALDPTNFPMFTPLPLPDLESPAAQVDQNYERCQGISRCMGALNLRGIASSAGGSPP